MTRYIDADKLIENFNEYGNITFLGNSKIAIHGTHSPAIMAIIDRQPTADVVPRSEVEELIDERDRYKKYYFRHEYDKWEAEIKQEVAREIFALIKLYKQKWASGEIVPYRFIAELEKKYIGE